MKKTSMMIKFFLLFFCSLTLLNGAAFGYSKIPPGEIKAAACIVEDKVTGEQIEVDRLTLPNSDLLWMLADTCKRSSKEYAERKRLSDWDYQCCPVTADGKVHCEAPIGR